MLENLAFVIWLGIAVLALVGAEVSLWHRRRILSRSRRLSSWQVARQASSTDPAKPHSVIAS